MSAPIASEHGFPTTFSTADLRAIGQTLDDLGVIARESLATPLPERPMEAFRGRHRIFFGYAVWDPASAIYRFEPTVAQKMID